MCHSTSSSSFSDVEGVCVMDRIFRPNVAALIKIGNQFLCAERSEPRGVWQTVQGGVESADTSLEQALLREMHEELGVISENVRIIERSRYWRRYVFPTEVLEKHPERKNIGQEQMWFVVQIPSLDCIDLKQSEGEFVQVELVSLDRLLSQIVSWKLPIVKDFCYEMGLLNPLAVETR
jgi:putative (di)nucleoside polyphosphate hydrolase